MQTHLLRYLYGKNSNDDNKKTQAVDTFHKST